MTDHDHQYFLRLAIQKASEGVNLDKGGPFGAILVKDGQIIGEGYNSVTSSNDPTAHAEVVAIRDACKRLENFNLEGSILYSSCEPCPMCLGAIYWARISRLFYACTREDAANFLFDDDFIYNEIHLHPNERSIPGIQLLRKEGLLPFEEWRKKDDKIEY